MEKVMNNGIDEVTLARLHKEREASIARQAAAPGLFLEAWKKAVKMAGASLFTCHRDYNIPSSIDAATDKWQLIPDVEAINKYFGVSSTGEALFAAVLYSFYNSAEGQAMLQNQNFKGLGDISKRLEHDQLQIITDLMHYHTGW
jgi:hypothetical protein